MLVFSSTVSKSQQLLCPGSIVKYNVDGSENFGNGTNGSTYYWKVQETNFRGKISNTLPSRTNEIMLDWLDTPPGKYHLIVNELNAGCTGLNQILNVEILALPISNLSNQSVCINPITKELVSKALLDTKLSESNYNFKWQLDGTQLLDSASNMSVEKLGTYNVEISDKITGCKIVDTAVVKLSSNSVSTIKVDNLFQDNQIILVTVVNGIGEYEYSINGIDFQNNPEFNVSKPGVYSIVVKDENGCTDEILTANIIFYPKFFTPNNDGYFDFWKIEGLIAEMKPKIAIFDRFNTLLKVISLEDTGWDGTFSGINLPSDDYWFTIEYFTPEGKSAIFKSHFSLIR